MTPAASPDASRPATRRARTASESLLSIVLALEAALMFFVTVTAFGLKVVSPGVAFGGGAVLFVALLLTARFVRYNWGVWLGWAFQAVIISIGVLMPLMFFIGAGFLALWIFCFFTARRLDSRNLSLASDLSKENP